MPPTSRHTMDPLLVPHNKGLWDGPPVHHRHSATVTPSHGRTKRKSPSPSSRPQDPVTDMTDKNCNEFPDDFDSQLYFSLVPSDDEQVTPKASPSFPASPAPSVAPTPSLAVSHQEDETPASPSLSLPRGTVPTPATMVSPSPTVPTAATMVNPSPTPSVTSTVPTVPTPATVVIPPTSPTRDNPGPPLPPPHIYTDTTYVPLTRDFAADYEAVMSCIRDLNRTTRFMFRGGVMRVRSGGLYRTYTREDVISELEELRDMLDRLFNRLDG